MYGATLLLLLLVLLPPPLPPPPRSCRCQMLPTCSPTKVRVSVTTAPPELLGMAVPKVVMPCRPVSSICATIPASMAGQLPVDSFSSLSIA